MNTSTEYLFTSVMLVDDSRTDNFVNQRMIKRARFAEGMLVYTKGKNALKTLLTYSELGRVELLPDVLLLDVNLRDMHGTDFLAAIEHDKFIIKNVKIVLISAFLPRFKGEEILNRFPFVRFYFEKPLLSFNMKQIAGLSERGLLATG